MQWTNPKATIEEAASLSNLIELPKPAMRGTRTLEEVLRARRSSRHLVERPLELEKIAQLLWAGQGIRDASGLRTAPSAGQRYPLDMYLVSEGGVAHYLPLDHALEWLAEGDIRQALSVAARNQEGIREAPAIFIITADFARSEHEHGPERAVRFAHMEAGHVGQNILLQAYALGLAGVAFGAFDDEQVQTALPTPVEHQPLYIVPIGYIR